MRRFCQGLLTNLASRGLRTDRSLLVIVDGAKALDTAVTQTFGRAALVQRCQVHKGRNILEYLPEAQRPWVKTVLTRAYTNSHAEGFYDGVRGLCWLGLPRPI